MPFYMNCVESMYCFFHIGGKPFHVRKILKRFTSKMNQESVKEFEIPTPHGPIAAKLWNESGKKTPILASHGFMDNAGTWDCLCPLLSKDHPLVAFDAPGHGLSSHFPPGVGNYTINYVIALHRVLNFMTWEKVILLGHSMGAGVSQLYAGTMPERIHKLIMIDLIKLIHIDAEDQPKRTRQSLQTLLEAEEKLSSQPPHYEYEDLVTKIVKSYKESLTPEAARVLLIRGSRRHEDGKYSLTQSPLLKAVSTLSMTYEQQAAFAYKLTCDTLLIKGTLTQFFNSVETSRAMLDLYIKNCSHPFALELLESSSHHFHLTNPEPVAKIINAFLRDEPQDESSKKRAKEYLNRLRDCKL